MATYFYVIVEELLLQQFDKQLHDVESKANNSSNWVVEIELLFSSKNKRAINAILFEFIPTSLRQKKTLYYNMHKLF